MALDHIAAMLRTLSTTPSRRAVSRALVGLAAGSVLASWPGLADVEANKKHKRHDKKKDQDKEPCKDGKQRCGKKCYSKCPKSGQIRDNTCTCRCLTSERTCPDGSCVPSNTCCPSPWEVPCPADSSGCCSFLAGEFCTDLDGCCSALVDQNFYCGGQCCPGATHVCCFQPTIKCVPNTGPNSCG